MTDIHSIKFAPHQYTNIIRLCHYIVLYVTIRQYNKQSRTGNNPERINKPE
jgi:hypothetical protein